MHLNFLFFSGWKTRNETKESPAKPNVTEDISYGIIMEREGLWHSSLGETWEPDNWLDGQQKSQDRHLGQVAVTHEETLTERTFGGNEFARCSSQGSILDIQQSIPVGKRPHNQNSHKEDTKQNSELIKTQSMFVGKKIYECNECRKTFSQRSALTKP